MKIDWYINKQVIEKNGVVKQSIVAMEELSELIQAISKKLRYPTDTVIDYNLEEEIADVYIMLDQLMIIYDIDESWIDEWIKAKQNREKKRLESVEP